jgi:hypothetical protein
MAIVVNREPDAAAVEQFIGRGITDIAGAMTTILCIVGDRLGLFRALDERPATAAEFATRAGIDERYALEWLRGLASAGYLEQDPDGRYALPPAHAVVLAREGNPMFVGGAFHELGGMLPALERVIEAFRAGGGVPRPPIPTTPTPAWPASPRRGSTTTCSGHGCRCCPSCASGSSGGSDGPTSAVAPAAP